MSLYYNKTQRVTVRRRAGRGAYDRETIDAILDEGFVGHMAFNADGQPYAVPMLYARGEGELFLHGSPVSRLIRSAASGIPVCFTVTLIDAAEDYGLPVWAGELPLKLVPGEPVPDDRCAAPEPAYLRAWGHAYA